MFWSPELAATTCFEKPSSYTIREMKGEGNVVMRNQTMRRETLVFNKEIQASGCLGLRALKDYIQEAFKEFMESWGLTNPMDPVAITTGVAQQSECGGNAGSRFGGVPIFTLPISRIGGRSVSMFQCAEAMVTALRHDKLPDVELRRNVVLVDGWSVISGAPKTENKQLLDTSRVPPKYRNYVRSKLNPSGAFNNCSLKNGTCAPFPQERKLQYLMRQKYDGILRKGVAKFRFKATELLLAGEWFCHTDKICAPLTNPAVSTSYCAGPCRKKRKGPYTCKVDLTKLAGRKH